MPSAEAEAADSRSAADRRADAPAEGALGKPVPVPEHGWRARVRKNPPVYAVYRVGVFVVGLVFMAIGVALAALPGPLTIPPVLLGLYIWSTEFRFAKRFFDKFKQKADQAWQHAKEHPVSSTAITVGGLVAAGVAFWAVSHYDLVAKARDAVGI